MHYSLLKSLIAFGLLSTAMARDYHYRDTPARQTPAVESPEYDAGLSPLPTPEPGLELRGAVLGPRSLASDNCGYRQREDGGESAPEWKPDVGLVIADDGSYNRFRRAEMR